jgi:hypothetical protein
MRSSIPLRLFIALLVILAPGCRGPASPAVAPVARSAAVRYYVGSATTTSPDGAHAYGPATTIAARRTIDSAAGTIDEYVVHPGRAFPTHLQRGRAAGSGVVFTATDEADSFSGTVTFAGPDWAWTTWTYDLAMRDGSGTLRGEGRSDGTTIDTDKLFIDRDGQPRARIREHLAEVDARTFARVAQVLAPLDATRPRQ